MATPVRWITGRRAQAWDAEPPPTSVNQEKFEGRVHVVTYLMTDPQALGLVEPGESPLDSGCPLTSAGQAGKDSDARGQQVTGIVPL
ncbi:hypothetical protein GCM10010381_60270 [Streptomyces xantholiticus]|nr:hypothetical protein GCM10010381_60270 [Streptomyces xantholiticus]